MNNKILFINIAQYGKHTDTYKYCAYLNKNYTIYYLCIDNNLKKIKDNTNVIYIKDSNSSIKNVINLILESRKLIKENNFKIILITYFKLCFLIKIFLPNNYILDIRTGAVDKKLFDRIKYNTIMKFESFFFTNISIISESLLKQLKYKKEKCTIIPLGSDILSIKNKEFKKNNLSLLYIGTLSNRNIYQTVYGLKKFIDKMTLSKIKISYDIFGDGLEVDVKRLKQSIIDCELNEIVRYHGRRNHKEIQQYLDNCNIGISYIPITSYFNNQPPTKTFEYINSGMICLATKTNENKKIINSSNGILCLDNEDSFKESLLQINEDIENYNSVTIRKTVEEYTWQKIVFHKVKRMFERIIKENI